MTMHWLRTLVCACSIVGAHVAIAVPVTYTFHAIASGTLAGAPFAHKPLTFRLGADTATVEWDAAHVVGRNVATATSLTLDGVEIGPAGQLLAVAMNCAAAGNSVIGVDLAHTVLPALDLALSGTAGSSVCNAQSTTRLVPAVPAVGAAVVLPTDAGTLTIESVDSLAYESLVLYAPSLKLRVLANPYGPLSVQGANFDGTTITGYGGNVVIDLGPGSAPDALVLQYENLVIGPSQTMTLRAGAAAQRVSLVPPPYFGALVSIQGNLVAMGSSGATAPGLVLSAASLEVAAQGALVAPSGATVVFPVNAGYVNNHGVVDGGSRLRMNMTGITGGGLFKGDTIALWSLSRVGYPVNGRFYLGNGLHVAPSAASEVEIVPRTFSYGEPNFLNLTVHGDALLWMPSAWPAAPSPDAFFAPNNVGVSPGDARPPGASDPTFGGGSLLVRATGSLRLKNGGSNDFVFPGSIVLKAAGTLDLNGLAIIQGWTTTGKAFQGAFFESANIVSTSGSISVYTNDLNWANFSTMPHAAVRAFTLARNADGSGSYAPADSVAPHLNTYSLLIDAAANGGCWTCLVNAPPVDMTSP
ncbi:MAG: hypothetical protein U1F15_15255 [Burkholderiales bacterium]